MGIAVKKNTHIGVVPEVTEGTFEPADSATDYVQTLADGFELNQTKEVIERNIFTGSIGKTSPRTGQFQASGTIPVEMRASSTAGAAPEFTNLLESALGSKVVVATTTTTKSSGNTASILQIEDADISKFAVGDIVMTKAAGAFHVSPITAVDTTGSAANITLLIPHPSGDHPDSVVIEKATHYKPAEDGHPSLSISKWIEETILEKAVGCKVTTCSIENFTTGQIPTMNFGFEGLNFDREVDTIPATPSYSSALPPILLDGRVYQGTDAIDINELALSIENTLGFVTSIAAPNGRVSSRVTERAITGSFNPYKPDDAIDNFTKYKNDTPFTIFAYGKLPTGVDGEFSGVIAIYLRNVLITELGEADQDGLLQETIAFSADRGVSGTTPEITITFI
jgi:hypothetical protein